MASNKQQIIDLETRFWQAMKEQDVAGAQAMVAEESLLAGPFGTVRVSPAQFARLMREKPWKLERFELSEEEVIFPGENFAVMTYKIHETGEMEGRPMDMICADSSVWARDRGDWKCALHTETILEDKKARQPELA